MDPRFAKKAHDVERRILEAPGTLDPSIRRAAASGVGVPAETARFVDKVRRHAFRVTDRDVEELRSAGYSEDQIFELTVAAAFGAAAERLRAGLAAMSGADPHRYGGEA